MRFIKGTFLAMLTFLFIIILFFTQLYIAFDSTFLSSDYFKSSFDENNISTTFKDIFLYRITNSDFSDQSTNNDEANSLKFIDIKSIILKYLDETWLKDEISNITKGTYSYLLSDSNKLPPLNIEPLKVSLLNNLTNEILKQQSTQNNLELIKKIIKSLDTMNISSLTKGENIEKLLTTIMNSSIVKNSNLDKDIVLNILRLYREDKLDNMDKINEVIVSQIINTTFNIEDIGNEFNINLLIKEIYKDKENPLTSFRNFISNTKSIILITFLTLISLIIIIMIITNLNVSNTLRWISIGMIVSGSCSILIGLLKYTSIFTKTIYYNTFYNNSFFRKIETLNNMENWVNGFVNRFFTILLIQGAILIFLAILIFFILKFLSKHNYSLNYGANDSNNIENDENDTVAVEVGSKLKTFLIIGLRFIVVCFLIIIIPFTIINSAKNLQNEYDIFRTNINQGIEIIKNVDMFEVLQNTIK